MAAKRERRITLRAQWLGQMLRQLREQSDLTLKDAAEYLQKDFSTVSRFELGTFPVRRGDLLALMDLYGIDDKSQRDMLTQLCGEVWQTGWWENYLSDSIWGSTIDLVWLENRAHGLRTFSPLTVPGLLQTADYTRELFRVADPGNTKSSNEKSVALRMERQKILTKEEPTQLSVVLDEGVLRRTVDGASTMRKQLTHLRDMANRPNIEIRVLPFTAGAHASPDGAFTLLKLDTPFPEVAHIESPGGAIYLERDDVDRLAQMYDRLQESSLSTEESVAFIATMEKDLS